MWAGCAFPSIAATRLSQWMGIRTFAAESAAAVDGFDAEELGGLAKLFFDPEKLVVLGDAVRAAGGAGLDLSRASAHCEVRDEGVFRLAGTMADDAGVTVTACELDGLERLRDRADLVDLNQNGV